MNKKLKMLSLFSGIGAFEEGLKNLGVDYELINYCEFDEPIARSYSLIHNIDIKKNLGDITKVEEENNTNFTKNDIKNIVINYLSGSDDEALDLLLQDNEVDTSGCNVDEFFKVMDCIRELYKKCK